MCSGVILEELKCDLQGGNKSSAANTNWCQRVYLPGLQLSLNYSAIPYVLCRFSVYSNLGLARHLERHDVCSGRSDFTTSEDMGGSELAKSPELGVKDTSLLSERSEIL